MKKILLVAAVVAMAGCSTAGPYVTQISSDGNNGLNIEKCMVKFNPWTATVTNDQCTSQAIRLRQ